MKPFINPDFLLHSPLAQHLYHDHAAALPIIDYHCHLSPQMVADDYRFRSLTEVWLGGDHYKWRAMRTNGVAERYCTGTDTTDYEKFEAWAATMPYCMRNPLYHWSHLELKTAFGIDDVLKPETARKIYDHCTDLLQNDPNYTARGLMRRYNVELVCTTDDPVDDLHFHTKYAAERSETDPVMLPAWRPDKAMAVENPVNYRAYIERLSQMSGIDITTFADLRDALQKRHDFFAANGCRLSDHGLEEFYAEDYTDAEVSAIFTKVMSGAKAEPIEVRKFKSAMLILFAEMDHASDWTQQFHYGAIRDNNTGMFRRLGPDTGFDSIGQFNTAQAMSRFFNRLATDGHLTRTIIYNLNPADNAMVATMLGNFQDGTEPGKIQWGSGWWFMDQKRGMEDQMNTLSVLGLLSRFVGMLTDSRSFLSYPRHEYFRRILCNLIATDVVNGELPESEVKQMEQMVEDISYYNAKRYFKF
ncbi:MAG: glucuronate isomerase [Bacteroidaceae bacterium]|nr:glucuronate isomerase [Bacteroidaceae bacterium]